MDKKDKKAPEWKDTSESWMAIEEPSHYINRRCVFFYSRAKSFKKALNNANKFLSSDKIVIVYLYGDVNPTVVEKYIKPYEHHIIVFYLKIDNSLFDEYDKCLKFQKSLSKSGITYDSICKEIDKCEAILQQSDLDSYNRDYVNNLLESKQLEKDKLDRISEIEETLKELQTNATYTAMSNLFETQECNNPYDLILQEAIKIYPYGVEANTNSDSGAKSLSIQYMVKALAEGKTNNSVKTIFSDENKLDMIAQEVVSKFEKIIDEIGYVLISDITALLTKPPYGYYMCNYYIYLRGKILQAFLNDNYLLGLAVAGIVRSHEFIDKKKFYQYPSGVIVKKNDKSSDIIGFIKDIFDVKEDIQCLAFAKTTAIRLIEQSINTPLECVDKRWREFLCCDPCSLFDVTFLDKMYDFFKDVDSRKQDLLDVNGYYYNKCEDKQKLNLFYNCHGNYMRSIGWLGQKEEMDRRIDAYMNSSVCKQCGLTIEPMFKNDSVFIYQREDGEIMFFSKEKVIALSKMITGEDDGLYCIHCLSDKCGHSPEEIYNMCP